MKELKTPLLTVDGLIFRNDFKEILLIKRINTPFGWALPGGFVDIGESCEDAVRREIKEEVSLTCVNVSQFGVYSDPSRDPRSHTVSVVYIAEDYAGDPIAGSDAKQCEWHDTNNLPEEIAFDHRTVIEDFFIIKDNECIL